MNESKLFSGFNATDNTNTLIIDPSDEIRRLFPKLKLGKERAPVENNCCTNPARKPRPPPAKISVSSSSSKIGCKTLSNCIDVIALILTHSVCSISSTCSRQIFVKSGVYLSSKVASASKMNETLGSILPLLKVITI